MPCSAVSVWCAASASSSASTSRLTRSAASSRARFFSVLILAADSPSRPSRSVRAWRTACWSKGSNALRRPQIAAGARGGKLLAADDVRETDKAGLAPPQRGHARELQHGLQPRVLPDQRADGIFEVGLAVEVDGHCARKTITTFERDQCRHPFSALPRARTAICISATPFRRCSISTSRAQAGGRLLLRIEDIDPARCRPEFEAAIYEDLAWLGLAWETPVRRQSEHLARVPRRAGDTSGLGLVYPGFESRAEIASWWRSERRRAPGRAIPTARRSIPGRRNCFRPRARAADRVGRALCAAARHGGGARARRRSRLDRAGRRPRRRNRAVAARPASLGRRHPGAQGDADQLSPLGRGRRRVAGRHRRGARPGPVLATSVHRLLQRLLGLPSRPIAIIA